MGLTTLGLKRRFLIGGQGQGGPIIQGGLALAEEDFALDRQFLPRFITGVQAARCDQVLANGLVTVKAAGLIGGVIKG